MKNKKSDYNYSLDNGLAIVGSCQKACTCSSVQIVDSYYAMGTLCCDTTTCNSLSATAFCSSSSKNDFHINIYFYFLFFILFFE